MNLWGRRNVELTIVQWGSFNRSAELLSQRTKFDHCRRCSPTSSASARTSAAWPCAEFPHWIGANSRAARQAARNRKGLPVKSSTLARLEWAKSAVSISVISPTKAGRWRTR
jgi:hypothetical protein